MYMAVLLFARPCPSFPSRPARKFGPYLIEYGPFYSFVKVVIKELAAEVNPEK
jgi:hypothetical protein